jgi:hypothetical protein
MVNVPWCHDCNNPDGLCTCPETLARQERDLAAKIERLKKK